MLFILSTLYQIIHLWKLKTGMFLNRYLMHAINLLKCFMNDSFCINIYYRNLNYINPCIALTIALLAWWSWRYLTRS